MRNAFQVVVDVDLNAVELEARRRGQPVDQVFKALIAVAGTRLADSVRCMEGVSAVELRRPSGQVSRHAGASAGAPSGSES